MSLSTRTKPFPRYVSFSHFSAFIRTNFNHFT